MNTGKDAGTATCNVLQASVGLDEFSNGSPSVSICCITYNHEKFISTALAGFLMQATTFPVEIIVHDDCSTDGTVQVIQSFQSRNPGKIRTILQEENQYSKGKKISHIVFDQARGKYIAFCEGDDYWSDPNKLQRQVEHLEANSDAAGCFHDCVCVDDEDRELPNHYASRMYEPNYSQRDCLTDLRSSYPSSSLMFCRRVWTDSDPPSYIRHASSDEMLDLLITEHGTLDYLPYTMSGYRLHRNGAWQGSNDRQRVRAKLEQFAALSQDDVFYRRHSEIVDLILRDLWLRYWQLSGGGLRGLPLVRTARVMMAVNSPALLRRLGLLLGQECRAGHNSFRRIRNRWGGRQLTSTKSDDRMEKGLAEDSINH